MAAALAAGVMGFLLLEGVAGIVLGLCAAVATVVVLRRRSAADDAAELERVTADLPFATDLMVACLRAGRSLDAAVEVTAATVGGPLGRRLGWVSGQLRLGADHEEAWSSLAYEEATAPLARAMIRATSTGSPVADALIRIGDDAMHAARARSSASARRVGVHAVAPLGLCFLPAFALLGIVPVIAALASQIIIP
ncbi:pilus assembly protein TadC [Thermocatellispora tengchongensis]|uniref:Pilus assembly protein TadC n=1 Tax=Thermocatellispora tengchongensis TaxID=1073253 RepID=A0A840PKP3_9ACTN|nr:type II secretion system F family protein [Thermocatellispora tengchongensis]MBB5137637.1 pilus assembly protein TadC [Thermocatellispora tengchongensis]